MVVTLKSPIPHSTLPDADWGDAYAVSVGQPFESARLAGEAVVNAFPVWTLPLLVLRNILVAPFGLKNTKAASELLPDPISFFPVQSESQHEVVVGFDDRHLDFRLIIALESLQCSQRLTLTTVVHRNNLLGRVYLSVVMPFHRAIIKSALRKIERKR